MKLKGLLRQVLLLPLWPSVFLQELRFLRALGVLPPTTRGNWPPQRVLIINLTGNLGDAMMMLPTVDALKRALPDAEVDLVVDQPMAAALRGVPHLRQVLAFRAGKTAIPLLGHYVRLVRMFQFARREWTDRTYDLVLLPRWGTDPFLSAYLAAMSTAPVRVGHNPADEHDAEHLLPGLPSLMTAASSGGQGMAEGVREQRVLITCGLMEELDPETEERRAVESVIQMGHVGGAADCMRRLGIATEKPFILLAPGASHPARRWPAERFARLGRLLQETLGMAVYTVGGPGDRSLGHHIETLSEGSVRSLIGETSTLELVALAQKGALLITNDSGPAHVGGGLGIPTLVLSVCPLTSTREHANSPRRVRPVGPRVRVLQPDDSSPGCGDRCLHAEAHCILGLSLENVYGSAEQMLAESTEGKVAQSSRRTARSTTAGAPAATQ